MTDRFEVSDVSGFLDEQLENAASQFAEEIEAAGIQPNLVQYQKDTRKVLAIFDSPGEAAQWLNMVAKPEAEPDSLYNRASLRANDRPDRQKWEYRILPKDENPSEIFDEATGTTATSHEGSPNFSFLVGVLIPVCDLNAIRQRLVSEGKNPVQ